MRRLFLAALVLALLAVSIPPAQAQTAEPPIQVRQLFNAMTPEDLQGILTQAADGYCDSQAVLLKEVQEKEPVIAAHLATRPANAMASPEAGHGSDQPDPVDPGWHRLCHRHRHHQRRIPGDGFFEDRRMPEQQRERAPARPLAAARRRWCPQAGPRARRRTRTCWLAR